ncbi:MAG: metalloprotease, partial [Flavobacteriaceae bacterium]|nr:metalloprotease [Flavobacteriaceae bacterium]
PFANRWITTFNTSASIWKYIFAYGDVGLVNNKNIGTEFFYDSGFRVNLVQDFFELYFPMYTSNGFEPSLNDRSYARKIRFIVSLDIQTLMRLFTREWY